MATTVVLAFVLYFSCEYWIVLSMSAPYTYCVFSRMATKSARRSPANVRWSPSGVVAVTLANGMSMALKDTLRGASVDVLVMGR